VRFIISAKLFQIRRFSKDVMMTFPTMNILHGKIEA